MIAGEIRMTDSTSTQIFHPRGDAQTIGGSGSTYASDHHVAWERRSRLQSYNQQVVLRRCLALVYFLSFVFTNIWTADVLGDLLDGIDFGMAAGLTILLTVVMYAS